MLLNIKFGRYFWKFKPWINDVRFTCCRIPCTLQSRQACCDVTEMQDSADGQIP